MNPWQHPKRFACIAPEGLDISRPEPLLDEIYSASILGLDIEATSYDAITAEPLSLAISSQIDRGLFFLWHSNDFPDAILADSTKSKVMHNVKYDYILFKRFNKRLNHFIDTMIAAHLLNQRNLKLTDCVAGLQSPLSKEVKTFSQLVGTGRYKRKITDLNVESVIWYSIPHARATLALWQDYEPKLKAEGMEELFFNIELPLIPVLADMELTGIALDIDYLKLLLESYSKRSKLLEESLAYHAGGKFNFHSHEQLGYILFSKLGLPRMGNTKKKRVPRTDSKVLAQLKGKHIFVDLLHDYRENEKIRSTYLESLIDMNIDSRIHTSFSQVRTETGRLSSSEPNLQNIPIRSERGVEIRKAFIPSPGNILFSVDAEQTEFKVLAFLSKDPKLIEVFKHNQDLHDWTAKAIFGSSEKRREGKQLNFAVLYGAGVPKIAELTGLSPEEAEEWQSRYFRILPGVKDYIKAQRKKAKADGFVTTLFNRKRFLPNVNSPDSKKREEDLRIAINTAVQGTAAELIKMAMIKIHKQLSGLKSRMILQVHDELLFDVVPNEARELEELIRDAFWEVGKEVEMPFPFSCKILRGQNWLEIH